MPPESITLTVAVAIISILAGWLGNKYFTRAKKPVYCIKRTRLFNEKQSEHEGLLITYQGKEMKDLHVTTLAFWNAGKETIERGDIIGGELLFFAKQMIDAKVLYATNNANGIAISSKTVMGQARKAEPGEEIDGRNLIAIPEGFGEGSEWEGSIRFGVSFDHLDKDEGMVLQFFSENSPIIFPGKHIKGCATKRSLYPYGAKNRWFIASMLIGALSMLFALAVCIQIYVRYIYGAEQITIWQIVNFILFTVLTVLGTLLMSLLQIYVPSPPKPFRKYFE